VEPKVNSCTETDAQRCTRMAAFEAVKLAHEVIEHYEMNAPSEDIVFEDFWDYRLAKALLSYVNGSAWIPLGPKKPDGLAEAPFDGKPVLIATDHSWTNRIHRVVWTDAVHGHGIYSWALEDLKHGPYPLRGYSEVTHWMPLPAAPEVPNG
jgi:hypothetical protein